MRAATIALFRGLTPEMAQAPGIANGVRFTAAAKAWLIAGHERHHHQQEAPDAAAAGRGRFRLRLLFPERVLFRTPIKIIL